MGELLIWAVFGLIVGVIANHHAGQRSGGIIVTMLIGSRILVGGYLERAGGPLRARTVAGSSCRSSGARGCSCIDSSAACARDGSGQFVVGANLPWLRYGWDFGANAWSPQGGLASRGRDARARRTAGLAACARRRGPALVRALRWPRRPEGRARRNARRARRLRLHDFEFALEYVRAGGLR